MKAARYVGRTTPFIFFPIWLSLVGAVPAAEPTGRWLFADDGSGVEIARCATAAEGLCGTLVQLPRGSDSIPAAQRKQLCGLTMLGALKEARPRKNELSRLDGWVLNPEDLARTDRPTRYEVSLIVTSQVSARLDVRGAFGIVLESHRLMRPVAPAAACE